MYEPNPITVLFQRYWTTLPVLGIQLVALVIALSRAGQICHLLFSGKGSPDRSRRAVGLKVGQAALEMALCCGFAFVLTFTYRDVIRLHEYELRDVDAIRIEILTQDKRTRATVLVTDARRIDDLMHRLNDNVPYYWRHEGRNDAEHYVLKFYRAGEQLPETIIVYPGTDKRPAGGVVFLNRANWPDWSDTFDNRGVREWIDSVAAEQK